MQIDACRVAGVNENIANLLLAAKFGVLVYPHAGGVGLCELVQHLAMFDHVALGGLPVRPRTEPLLEWIDHLHEHFVEPARVVAGRYQIPKLPGASTELRQASIKAFSFLGGPGWNGQVASRPASATISFDDHDAIRRSEGAGHRQRLRHRARHGSLSSRPRRSGGGARPWAGVARVQHRHSGRRDVIDSRSVDHAVHEAVGLLGGLDILVNNAGIGAQGTVEDNADEEWHRVLDVNVLGIVRVTRAALPHLRRSPTCGDRQHLFDRAPLRDFPGGRSTALAREPFSLSLSRWLQTTCTRESASTV